MMTVESLFVMILMSLAACEKFLWRVYLVLKRDIPAELVMYASWAPFAASWINDPDISNMRGGFLYGEEYSPERKGEQVTSLLGIQPQWYVHPTKAAMCTAFASSVCVPSAVRYRIL